MVLTPKQQYSDPRWYELCERIKKRDGNKCRICNSSNHVLELPKLIAFRILTSEFDAYNIGYYLELLKKLPK